MTHIQETVPHEHQKSNVAVDQVLRMCWDIVHKPNITSADRTRLQALALIKDCRKYKDELASDKAAIMDAIKYINQKTEQLNTLKMLDERIEGIDKEIGKEEATSSGLF
jgi:hypothetical protein